MLGSSAPTIGSWIRPLPRKVKRRWVSERAEQCGAKISRRSHTSTHQETSVPDTAAPHRDDRCFNERSTRIKLKTAVGFVGRKPTTLLHARSVPLPPSTYRLSSTTRITAVAASDAPSKERPDRDSGSCDSYFAGLVTYPISFRSFAIILRVASGFSDSTISVVNGRCW